MTITTTELAAMRDTADDYLPDTCTITRPTAGHTATGAPTLPYSNVATGVACRMDEPITATPEGSVSGALGTVVRWPMHMKYDQDVTVKGRVVHNSKTYEVAEVLDSASWLITRRLMVVRIE